MLQEKFLKILETYGYWKCKRFIGRDGAGAFVRCPGSPIHSCTFIFDPLIPSQIIKIAPRYPNNEQKRMFRYSSEGTESYFKVYPITRRRKPSK